MNTKRVWSYEAMMEELQFLNGVLERKLKNNTSKTGDYIQIVTGQGISSGHFYWDISTSLYN